MSGGQQGNSVLDQYQQQQQYKELGNTLTKSLQGAGSLVANANSGLSGQVAQPPSTLTVPQSAGGTNYDATGALFGGQGMGGGIDEQQLAQILRLLGYGG